MIYWFFYSSYLIQSVLKLHEMRQGTTGFHNFVDRKGVFAGNHGGNSDVYFYN